ncbi:MAG: YraN family protein [Cryobacterium sp.]|nr:YraN family protein [Oligoflexia bacterium]
MNPAKLFSSPRFFPSRIDQGAKTERAALEFLKAKGCLLIEKNVRFRVGEIDLVMKEGDCLVFVEVRGRVQGAMESAQTALPPLKRMKLVRAVETYLLRMPLRESASYRSVRIDFLSHDGVEWFWCRNIEMRS